MADRKAFYELTGTSRPRNRLNHFVGLIPTRVRRRLGTYEITWDSLLPPKVNCGSQIWSVLGRPAMVALEMQLERERDVIHR